MNGKYILSLIVKRGNFVIFSSKDRIPLLPFEAFPVSFTVEARPPPGFLLFCLLFIALQCPFKAVLFLIAKRTHRNHEDWPSDLAQFVSVSNTLDSTAFWREPHTKTNPFHPRYWRESALSKSQDTVFAIVYGILVCKVIALRFDTCRLAVWLK